MMRLLLLTLLAVSCGPEPKRFDPTQPHAYRVLRGDNWRSISSKRDTTPETLRAWNDLPDDHLLVPGQILMIYPGQKTRPSPRPVSDSTGTPADATPSTIAKGTGSPTPPPASTERGSPSTIPSPPTPGSIDGLQRAPGGTSLLSLLDDIQEDDTLRHVPSVTASTLPGSGGLGDRQLGGGGQVDATTVAIDRVSAPPPPGMAGPATIPTLPKAERKNCLPVRLDVDIGEKGMVAAEGLGKDQVKAGMRPVLRAVGQCLPPDAKGSWEVHLQVMVGCDGLVYGADVIVDADLPSPITTCVAKVADQAGFDAAAGATTFLYPIHLRR